MNIKIAFLGILLIAYFTPSGWSQISTGLNLNSVFFQPNTEKSAPDYLPSKERNKSWVRPMVTNRPGVSESSKAVYKGGIQVETGIMNSNLYGVYNLQMPNLGLLYGLSNRVELRLFTTANFNSFNRDNLDVYAGVKVNIFDQKKLRPELAFVFNQEVPHIIFNKPRARFYSWKSNFILAWSHTLSKRLNIAGNLKYVLIADILRGETTTLEQLGYTFNSGYKLKKNLGVFLEVYGNKITLKEVPMLHYMDGGVWYRVDPTFQIDVQAGFSMNSDYYFFMVGFSKLILS